MSTARVNGVELFYERSGEGEAVVLTHGAWTDGRTWEAVSDRMADHFEVLAWDRRGHSRSQDHPGPGSVGEDAADLAALIEALGKGPVHAVGNSAGGNVVLNLVAKRPDLVLTASVHEPGPFGILVDVADSHLADIVQQDKARTTEVERLISGGEPRRALEYFLEEIALGPGAWQELPAGLKTVMEANAATVHDDLRDGWDARSVDIDALSASSVPLLISTGFGSPELERAAARELARRLPLARLETLEGAGHIPHRTHTDEYVTMLLEFMHAVSTPGPAS